MPARSIPLSRSGLALLLVAATWGCAGEREPRPPAKIIVGGPPAVAPAVRAACDSLEDVVSNTPGTTLDRSDGIYLDTSFSAPVTGCRLLLQGSFQRAAAGEAADDRVRVSLEENGWKEILAFAADSKDETAFAYRGEGAACHVRASWSGGVDGETETRGEDRYRLAVTCGTVLPARHEANPDD